MIGTFVKPLEKDYKYKFISFLHVYSTPKEVNEKLYEKNELAFHPKTEQVQVFVTSKTKEGVYQFFEDYPEAKLVRTPKLENLQEWKILAYPQAPIQDEAVPLDNFYVGKNEEVKLSLNTPRFLQNIDEVSENAV
jgi:hypothetical protein